MYRILDNLEWGSGRRMAVGSIDALKGLSEETISVLLARGVVSKVQAPPLKILPEWKDRAEELQAAGVEDVSDLLEADLPALSEELDTPLEELERERDEALQYIK